jgi:hypothetical protein
VKIQRTERRATGEHVKKSAYDKAQKAETTKGSQEMGGNLNINLVNE